ELKASDFFTQGTTHFVAVYGEGPAHESPGEIGVTQLVLCDARQSALHVTARGAAAGDLDLERRDRFSHTSFAERVHHDLHQVRFLQGRIHGQTPGPGWSLQIERGQVKADLRVQRFV